MFMKESVYGFTGSQVRFFGLFKTTGEPARPVPLFVRREYRPNLLKKKKLLTLGPFLRTLEALLVSIFTSFLINLCLL